MEPGTAPESSIFFTADDRDLRAKVGPGNSRQEDPGPCKTPPLNGAWIGSKSRYRLCRRYA